MTRKDSLLNKSTKHLDPNYQNNMLKKSILSFTNIKSNTSKSNKSEDMISSLNTSLMSSHFPKILWTTIYFWCFIHYYDVYSYDGGVYSYDLWCIIKGKI